MSREVCPTCGKGSLTDSTIQKKVLKISKFSCGHTSEQSIDDIKKIVTKALTRDYVNRTKRPRFSKEDVEAYISDFWNKYYNAPTQFLSEQKELLIDWDKKAQGLYSSVILAIIGIFFSAILVQLVGSWSKISDFFLVVTDSKVVISNILTLVLIVVFGILQVIFLRFGVLKWISTYLLQRQSIGDIELYIIDSILQFYSEGKQTVLKK